MPNLTDFYKSIFLQIIPAHITVSWYDTAKTTSDAITFTIPGNCMDIFFVHMRQILIQ